MSTEIEMAMDDIFQYEKSEKVENTNTTYIRDESETGRIIDFTGMGAGKKYGSNLDWIYDDGGKRFIIADFKHKGTKLPRGQEILFQNMVDGWQKGAIPSWVLIAEHNTVKGEKVYAKDTIVERYYHNGTWHNCAPITLLEMKNKLLS